MRHPVSPTSFDIAISLFGTVYEVCFGHTPAFNLQLNFSNAIPTLKYVRLVKPLYC